MPTTPRNQSYLYNLIQGQEDLPAMPLYFTNQELARIVIFILIATAGIVTILKIAKKL